MALPSADRRFDGCSSERRRTETSNAQGADRRSGDGGGADGLPTASAGMKVGNYSFNIEGRYDFHKWLWMVSSCNRPEQTTDCALISAVARPVAKAYDWDGHAQVINGRWSMTVDVPDGLRCGDIYYGPVIPTHDVYSWDPVTLAGTLESTSDVGCDNAPAGHHLSVHTDDLLNQRCSNPP